MDYLNKIITVHDCEIEIKRSGRKVFYETCVFEILPCDSRGSYYLAELMTGDEYDGECVIVTRAMLDNVTWTEE